MQTIAVIGAGLMGSGIAQSLAMGGKNGLFIRYFRSSA